MVISHVQHQLVSVFLIMWFTRPQLLWSTLHGVLQYPDSTHYSPRPWGITVPIPGVLQYCDGVLQSQALGHYTSCIRGITVSLSRSITNTLPGVITIPQAWGCCRSSHWGATVHVGITHTLPGIFQFPLHGELQDLGHVTVNGCVISYPP